MTESRGAFVHLSKKPSGLLVHRGGGFPAKKGYIVTDCLFSKSVGGDPGGCMSGAATH